MPKKGNNIDLPYTEQSYEDYPWISRQYPHACFLYPYIRCQMKLLSTFEHYQMPNKVIHIY